MTLGTGLPPFLCPVVEPAHVKQSLQRGPRTLGQSAAGPQTVRHPESSYSSDCMSLAMFLYEQRGHGVV